MEIFVALILNEKHTATKHTQKETRTKTFTKQHTNKKEETRFLLFLRFIIFLLNRIFGFVVEKKNCMKRIELGFGI